MTSPALLTAFARETWIWLAITLILGGAAAFVTGRALAQSWRGFGLATVYAALLAGATGFLCHALFQVSAIPLFALASAVTARDFGKVPALLAVWAVSFVILAVFAGAGWRHARDRLMAEQYGFSRE